MTKLFVALASLCICSNACKAQQAGSIDLTQIEARDELRRPPARQGDATELRGMVAPVNSCGQIPKDAPAVQTTLVWVDREEYSPGDKIKFEVRILNTGSVPLALPFSPHLADLQPADPGPKVGYSQTRVSLEFSSVLRNVSFTAPGGGGNVNLYGDESHPGTMLTLRPGEWAQIIGEGKFMINDWPPEAHSKDAINHLNATLIITQNETLLTSTDAATTERYICLNQTRGPNVPLKLRAAD